MSQPEPICRRAARARRGRRPPPRAASRAATRGSIAIGVFIRPGRIAFARTRCARVGAGELLGQPDHADLRRLVADLRVRVRRGHRRDVHDRAAALLAHHRERLLAGEPHPPRFTAKMRSHVATSMSVATASPSARLAPTLLCSASRRPCARDARVDGGADRGLVGDVDRLRVGARRPRRGSRRRCPPRARRRGRRPRTRAPSRASRIAVARPLPMVSPGVCPPPMTSATLPSTRPAMTAPPLPTRVRADGRPRRGAARRTSSARSTVPPVTHPPRRRGGHR